MESALQFATLLDTTLLGLLVSIALIFLNERLVGYPWVSDRCKLQLTVVINLVILFLVLSLIVDVIMALQTVVLAVAGLVKLVVVIAIILLLIWVLIQHAIPFLRRLPYVLRVGRLLAKLRGATGGTPGPDDVADLLDEIATLLNDVLTDSSFDADKFKESDEGKQIMELMPGTIAWILSQLDAILGGGGLDEEQKKKLEEAKRKLEEAKDRWDKEFGSK